MTFQSFSLHAQLLESLQQHGIVTPTPIQSMSIQLIMEGRDIQACAQTGTGKTLAFLLPTLHRLIENPRLGQGPRALVLVPTRELAEQVSEESMKFSSNLRRLKTVCIYGGMPYPAQKRLLSRPYEVLVATPGRLIDWIDRGVIDLSGLEVLILDEADRMLDMGFAEDVAIIAKACSPKRQTLLFSATLKGKVLDFSRTLLNSPAQITAESEEQHALKIEQKLYYADDLHHKNKLLEHILRLPECKQTIVFTGTKSHADRLSEELGDLGFSCSALHGDMNQRQRTRTLDLLKRGKIQILIATDVAARGVHVHELTHVINFDLPFRVEDYVHRIGRTGRAGAEGIAITFASRKEQSLVRRIEQYTNQSLKTHQIEGLEPKMSHVPSSRAPQSRGRSGSSGGYSGHSGRFQPRHQSGGRRARSSY